jgi:FMN phosphatase YigB (HAD superfamily)
MMVCGALSEMARDLFFHGSRKPSREFFARIVQISGVTPREIAHVGDRVDNDVLPAKAAGMVSVFLVLLLAATLVIAYLRRPSANA